MRDFSKFCPTFWTGETGRALRGDRDAQLVAIYLFTGPMANMIGLYHLPVQLIAHHIGSPLQGASKALRRVCETGFARFEGGSEQVFIPEMAAQQLGEPLSENDNRVKGIISTWQSLRKSPFYMDFYHRYRESFHLPEPKPLRSPFEAPSKPRDRDREGDRDRDRDGDGEEPAAAPLVVEPQAKARRASDPLWDALVAITGADPSIKSVASHIGKVRKALKEAKPEYTAADVLALPSVAAVHLPWAAGRVLTLGEVEKNIGLVRTHPPKVSANGRAADAMAEFLNRGV